MNVLIIGATKGIGKSLLEQALSQKHQVTVMARKPASVGLKDKNLHIVEGDIRDSNAVKSAVKNQDVVCLTIGIMPTRKAVTVFSEGTTNVVNAMKHHSVKKLICVTGIGAGDSKGHGGFLYDWIINPLFLKNMYKDKDRQEAIIQNSELDWVIVRPGFLNNGPQTTKYQIITDLQNCKAGKISRTDIAHFMMTQIESMNFLGKTPLLTY